MNGRTAELVTPAKAGVQSAARERRESLWIPAFAGMTALCMLTACAPREVLLPKLGMDVPVLHEFSEDFPPPQSNETDKPVAGFGGEGGGVTRTPVIFVHGNTVSARFWLPARAHFKREGYTGDELWALGYGWDSVRYFDSNDLSVPTLERFVSAVQNYLQRKTGKPVPQVDIIAHSLGVTLVRQWLKQENAWHRVRHFAGIAGGNHGVWTARMDSRGQNRVVSYELARGSPWLEQLNRGGETPGATRYLMVYDGSGWGDVLFPPEDKDNAALHGATNLAFNVERGTHYDHLELAVATPVLDAIRDFFQQGGAVPADKAAPSLALDAGVLRAQPAGAQVFCGQDGASPSRHGVAGAELRLESGKLNSCFAFDPATELASPQQHFKLGTATAATEPLQVSASVPAGAYANPISVTLTANDPSAYIVYTTSGSPPGSGSPLYTQPVYVPGPLTLTAMAVAPDGRRSPPLALAYDISLEKLEAEQSLLRQFNTGAPEQYAGERKKGR